MNQAGAFICAMYHHSGQLESRIMSLRSKNEDTVHHNATVKTAVVCHSTEFRT